MAVESAGQAEGTLDGVELETNDLDRVELVFSKEGVDYEFLVLDPIQSVPSRHIVHLGYEEAANKVRGPLRLLGCAAEKDEKTGVLLRIRLRLLPANRWASRRGRVSMPPLAHETRPVSSPMGGEGDASTIDGTARLAELERHAPPWRIPFLRRAVEGRGTNLVDSIRSIVKARGRVGRGDLERELENRGYDPRSGGFYASVSVLRDDFKEIRQTGRGNRAVFEWVPEQEGPAGDDLATTPGSLQMGTWPRQRRSLQYLNRPIRAFKFQRQEIAVRTYKEVLLWVAGTLARQDPGNLAKLATIRGTRRQYFSESIQSIVGVPMQVPGTRLFVETNLSADYIVKVCKLALEATGNSPDDLQIING